MIIKLHIDHLCNIDLGLNLGLYFFYSNSFFFSAGGQNLVYFRFYCEGTVIQSSGIVPAVCGRFDAGLKSPEPEQPQPSATQPRRRQPGWNRSACM